MSIEHLKKAIHSLSKLAEDNEQIPLVLFSVKLSKASQSYPEDHCIGAVANIVSKMSNSDKIFITRSEIKDLYRKLYTRNTKFAEVFVDELGEIEKAPEVKFMQKDDAKSDFMSEAYDKIVDPVLADGLNLAFGNSDNIENSNLINQAKLMCEAGLVGLDTELKLEARNSDSILFRANFNTPKGKTSVYIPVIQNQTPTKFIGNGAFLGDITSQNISDYITKHAGEKLNYTPDEILQAISGIIQDKETKEFSVVDMALVKMNSENGTTGVFAPSVLYQKIEQEGDKDIQTPVFNDEQINSFAKEFDSVKGMAEFTFGKDKINLASSMILRNLNDCGLNDVQLKVYKCDEKGVVYAVKSGSLAFNVPVKIDQNVHEPEVFISNGSIDEFNKSGITRLLTSNKVDYKVSAVASPLYDVKPSELVNIVEQAVIEKNFKKAEDALNVIFQNHSNDSLAYKTAFDIYMSGLSGTYEVKQSGCNKIIHNANHSSPVCGHLNIPVNKVFQDKHGTCRPLYRKDEQVSSGGYLMTNKIFL